MGTRTKIQYWQKGKSTGNRIKKEDDLRHLKNWHTSEVNTLFFYAMI
jgi:hypothetical protein